MARHQVRSVAMLAIALSGVAAMASAQGARGGNPAAPKLLVGTCKSSDQKLGPDAAEALRDRIGGDVSLRNLTVIASADIITVLKSSGYPTDEALSSADANALAKQVRADEYIECAATKTATGFQVSATLVLARDMYLMQPLGTFDAVKMDGVSSQVSKSFQEAQKAFDPEKHCRLLAREGKPADAQKEAVDGIKQYPKSLWLRVCQLEIARDTKRPALEIIKIAEDIVTVDANNRAALTELVKQYDIAGNKDKKIEVLLKLYRADPSNPRLLADVVNELALSGKYDVAKPIIEKAVAENPGDANLVHTYWLILERLNDGKKMNAVGEEMVKIDTSLADSTFYDRTIRTYAADSNYAKAAEAAARATAKFPKLVTFWVLRQALEKRAGQTQQSIASMRHIMQLDRKALPSARGQIAQAHIDMNQPDSAMAELRLGIKEGEDPKVMSSMVLRIGNAQQTALGADSVKKKEVNEWRKIYAFMSFADSISANVPETRAQAKFLLGVSAFQVGYLLLVDNQTNTKSCDVAKEAGKYLLQAASLIPAGGSFAAAAAGQYMGYLNETLPGADRAEKFFCRPKPEDAKGAKKPPQR